MIYLDFYVAFTNSLVTKLCFCLMNQKKNYLVERHKRCHLCKKSLDDFLKNKVVLSFCKKDITET